MPLPPIQRQLYELYAEFEVRPPSRMSLILKNWRNFVLFIGFGVLIGLLSYFFIHPFLAFFVLGMSLGGLLHMLGFLSKSVKAWPYLELIIDWNKLKTILKTPKG